MSSRSRKDGCHITAWPCPVPLDSKPEVMFRGGGTRIGFKARYWVTPGNFWDHRYRYEFQHIIAYKPEPNP